MKKKLALTLALSFFFSAQANFATTFPITVSCVDDQTNPKTKVEAGFSPANNRAQLTYHSQDMTEPLKLSVYHNGSIYSSSSVKIISNSRGMFNDNTTMKIDAASGEVLRVTRYKEFSLNLSQDNSGAFALTSLSYKSGIDAFPDSHLANTVTFDNLTCTITGL